MAQRRQGHACRAAAADTDDAGAVSIVAIEHAAVATGDLVELGQRWHFPCHAIDAIHGSNSTIAALSSQQRFKRVATAWMKLNDLGAIGDGDFGPLVDAVVRQSID